MMMMMMMNGSGHVDQVNMPGGWCMFQRLVLHIKA